MGGLGWQDVAVAFLAAGAVAFLIWRRRRRARPKPTIVSLGRAPKRPPGPGAANG
ncbi:MAG TPA: hypothetical protein VGJ96_06375 [Gemmatimonadaceae bacterium]|jgi:Na+-translocating ferredoxin:NAD+ oxidoreductase RnfD subunit